MSATVVEGSKSGEVDFVTTESLTSEEVVKVDLEEGKGMRRARAKRNRERET